MAEKHFQPGDTAVLRYPPEQRMVRCYQVITGNPVASVRGWPYVVLSDTDEMIALYLPEGSWESRRNVIEGEFRPTRPSQGAAVRLLYPGRPYEVTLFYDTGTGPWWIVDFLFPGVEGPFYGWKIDVASPFVRTDFGFDLIDETLDIMVTPDRSYRWKDEDQMAIFIELGIYTEQEAEVLRSAGRDAISQVEQGASPFDDEWMAWRPDPSLQPREMPDGWYDAPLASPYVPYDLDEDPAARLEASKRLRDQAIERRALIDRRDTG